MKSLLLSAMALLFVTANAQARGWDSGNAGDAYAAEFLFSGRDVLQRLELLQQNRETLTDVRKLREAMETTTVAVEEHVYVDGLERDAKNEPSKKLITVSRTRWRELRQSPETKARLTLVLHEFLWMAGVDDTNFLKSTPIIEKLNVPPYSPGIWLNSPGKAFAIAECTGQLEDGAFVTVQVNTKGATKSPDHGEVRIERDGNKFGYRFSAAEIAQFFENDDEDSNSAIVGLGAYVSGEFPIAVRYTGPNYVDMDLKAVIQTGGNVPAGSSNGKNSLRVWKGPGYQANDQYVVANPVCSVWSDN